VRRAAAALAVLAAGTAAGESPVLWHAQIDNDVAFHTDRWFTSGVRLYRSAALDPASPWAAFLRPAATREQRIDAGIVHEIYTGDGRADPAAADRPNAARLLFSIARHDISAHTLATYGLDAGVAGPAAKGEEVQDFIHRLFPAPKTDWTSQLGDRADVQFSAAWSHRLGLPAIPGALVVHGGGVAGTLTAFGHAGIEWRTGGPAEAANPLLRFAATPPLPARDLGLSLFAGASLRVVGRNRLLERREDDPKPEAPGERRVRRVAAGVAWSANWGVATLGLAQDSREFAGQPAPHRFGSLTLSLPAF
jgi:hypothetical protein